MAHVTVPSLGARNPTHLQDRLGAAQEVEQRFAAREPTPASLRRLTARSKFKPARYNIYFLGIDDSNYAAITLIK